MAENRPPTDLRRAIRIVLERCLAVQSGESVLVIANPSTTELAEHLARGAATVGTEAVLMVMDECNSNAGEPPGPVAAAMAEADVVLAPTQHSLTHTVARRAATDAGTRVATLPAVTAQVLARAMTVDLSALRRRGEIVGRRLTEGRIVRVTCPRGSDLMIVLGDRVGIPEAGDLTKPGAFGNLPCGEAYLAPLEGTAAGRLIVDGTIATLGVPSEPVELTLKAGHLVAAQGDPIGSGLMELLTAFGPDGTNLAELGIGTNDQAQLTGNLIEDEKVRGTAHVAFGASRSFGGAVQVPVHIDCVLTSPTVEIDDRIIVGGGELHLG